MRHFTDALFEEFEVAFEVGDLQEIADKIKVEVDAHENDGPYGNQNCMLCTWAVELQLRGENFLPRPVISEDDIIFEKGHYSFVKGGKKETFESVKDLQDILVDDARYYCHVNWADSEGGHEFLLVNTDGNIYIVDGQAGKVVELSEDNEYFNDINFSNSYIVRVDDKELNQKVLNLNNIDKMSKSALNEAVEIDELSINSPEELMDWMKSNITYELANDEYGAENDPPTKTAEEVIETKSGHCAEQSYLEKKILDGLGYETKLVFVKENNSEEDYGADGSAHLFLTYVDEDKICWFEHSMEHMRGIHKYDSEEELLKDVAKNWWRYDSNSDTLEVRYIPAPITGVDNWGLAQKCHKYPVEITFDISENVLEKDTLDESLENISYKDISDLDHYKKSAKEILGSAGGQSDNGIMDTGKEIYIDDKLVGYRIRCLPYCS